MGGSKPKPSGAAATRVMMRRGEGRVLPEAVRRGLYEGKRTQWVKLARKNNTSGGAKDAAAADAEPVQVCAAAWNNGHAGRAVARIKDAVKTLRSKPASAGGATAAENQKIQDLNIVVVGLLKNDKLLKQVMKAMCQRNGKLTEDLQKLQAEVDAMK